MYGWGSDDALGWKKPNAFKYDSAKAPYLDELKKEADEKGPRTYSTKLQPDMAVVDPKNKRLIVQSKNPIIWGIDGTGSMQMWPAEIFDRLPLFYQTAMTWRDDVEALFTVVGDGKWDKWPLQVPCFGKGTTLDEHLKALHGEGGGGPGIKESYELWAYFMTEHVETPHAVKPLMFLACDEKFYDTLPAEQIKKYTGDEVQGPLDGRTILKKLADKYDLYVLRKSYSGKDEEIIAQWREIVEPQRIVPVYDMTRVVDIALGITAEKWGFQEDFEKNIAARQDEGTIDRVMKSVYASVRPASAYVSNLGTIGENATLLVESSESKVSKKLIE